MRPWSMQGYGYGVPAPLPGLIRRRIPAVLTTQFEIVNSAAIQVRLNLYEHVTKRRLLDDSGMREGEHCDWQKRHYGLGDCAVPACRGRMHLRHHHPSPGQLLYLRITHRQQRSRRARIRRPTTASTCLGFHCSH